MKHGNNSIRVANAMNARRLGIGEVYNGNSTKFRGGWLSVEAHFAGPMKLMNRRFLMPVSRLGAGRHEAPKKL